MARHRDKWGKKGRKEKEGRKKGRGGKERYTGDTVPVSSPAAALPLALAQRRNVNTYPPAFLDARRAEGLALNPGPIVSPLSLFPEFPNRDTNVFAAYLRGFMGQKSVLPQSMSPWNL